MLHICLLSIALFRLMEGWQIIDTFGYDDNLLDFDFDILIQPIFVLVNI
jgi:hypothetical protein